MRGSYVKSIERINDFASTLCPSQIVVHEPHASGRPVGEAVPNDRLFHFIPREQARSDGGYVSFSNDTIDGWHYYIQDYMGNNRMVVNSDGTIEQVTHYYPYGGVIGDISTNENVQKYKFEGKELDRTFGLDNYDIHARQYFAMMPMWDRIDPLAEKFYGISPYYSCGGDPVNFGDYDGMDWYYVNDKGFVFNVRRCEENLLIGYNSQNKKIESITIDDKELMDNLVVKENEMSKTYAVKEMKDVKSGHGNILYGAYYNAHKSETKSEQAKDVIDFGYDKEGRIYKAHDHPNDINPEPGKMDIENSNSKIREYIYAPKTQTVIRYSGSKIVDKRIINVFKGFQLNF